MTVLVDSNVILDIFTNDPNWFDWSALQLTTYASQDRLAINPIIYAEIAVGFPQEQELITALSEDLFERLPLPWDAAFLAGQSFLNYRRRGGARTSPLPDFYIGAHASIANFPLITRDVNRYRTYFPNVRLISPE
ncbi:DNA-binding protein [Scytonema hofmannii PCC 7110]|uniref:DNA-binding protein n=1 Tax=Scytonema hofmannii PCC 7110 TaxID=128403 RepID=A0A139X9F4_9CYAN|nr:type II toxin-antitoxin system VapC family toxin [Scytonema hofmannii]KYC41320.1 DNA-binding protein [Scytonema hofmannii PCC 7110]